VETGGLREEAVGSERRRRSASRREAACMIAEAVDRGGCRGGGDEEGEGEQEP
jgi:hypothetical protein